jgi:heat-inducible transcriptional repressor
VLAERYEFDFSPATVRAEMLNLDEAGFLEQPHTSAGRVPTDKALRLFVEETDEENLNQSEKEQIWQKIAQLQQETVREMAQFLADSSRSLGISGFFGEEKDFHESGLKWLTEEPEFGGEDFKNIMRSFDSLEEDFNRFFGDIEEETEIFIGRENPIKYLRDYSLVITGFEKEGEKGILAILGSKRMNYQKNKFVVEETRKRVKNNKR